MMKLNLRAQGSVFVMAGVMLAACGGPDNETKTPSRPQEEAPDPSWETGPRVDPAPADEQEALPSPERKAPEFTQGMSVEDAISAVPSDYDYVGLDQDVLARPLQDPDLYEACNLSPSSKFTVKIAVWDGRVVGVDVRANNPALAECVERVVRDIEYKDRVESINTVEFSY